MTRQQRNTIILILVPKTGANLGVYVKQENNSKADKVKW